MRFLLPFLRSFLCAFSLLLPFYLLLYVPIESFSAAAEKTRDFYESLDFSYQARELNSDRRAEGLVDQNFLHREFSDQLSIKNPFTRFHSDHYGICHQEDYENSQRAKDCQKLFGLSNPFSRPELRQIYQSLTRLFPGPDCMGFSQVRTNALVELFGESPPFLENLDCSPETLDWLQEKFLRISQCFELLESRQDKGKTNLP